jgi:hypothetical protein
LLVGLRGLDKEGTRLIGSFILTQLLATVKLTKEEDRGPCHIYADEFHNFSPESFVEIIDQARKFNLFCTIAHQRLNQLNEDTISSVFNCENVVVFRVHPDDAQKLRKHFRTSKGYLSPEVLSRLKKWDALVKYSDNRSIGQVGLTTLQEKRPENREVAAEIWKRSISQGRSMAEIERYNAQIEQSLLIPKEEKPPSPVKSADSDTRQKGKLPSLSPPKPDDADFRQKGKRPPSAQPAVGKADTSNKAKGASGEKQSV